MDRGNPYINRTLKASKIGHGKLSEKRLAKSLNAQTTLASGATAGDKGDLKKTVGTTKFRMESKSTVTSTLKVDLSWLVKISVEALDTGAVPALTLSFVTESGAARDFGDWVAFPTHFVAEFFDLVKDR